MPETMDDWTRLCNLLDDDAEFAPAVLDAIEGGEAPWDALIGGLDDAGAVAYLDKSDTGAELAEALPALPRIFRTGVDLDEVGDVTDLDAAIARADEIITSGGLQLIHISDPEDEDAYPLVAVQTANVDEIRELIRKLGPLAT